MKFDERFVERSFPVITATIISAISYYYFSHTSCLQAGIQIDNINGIVNILNTVAITSLGFFLTITAIFFSMSTNEIMKKIHEAKGWRLLTQYLAEPQLAAVLLFLYSFFHTCILFCSKYNKLDITIGIWIFFFFILSAGRLIYFLLSIFLHIHDEPVKPITIDTNRL